MFDLLKGYTVHPGVADKLRQGLTARGLANYAADQVIYAEFRNKNRDNCINKAIASIGKAYSIYQLPIYLYDLACAYSAESGHPVQSKLDSRSVATRGLFFTPDSRFSSNLFCSF